MIRSMLGNLGALFASAFSEAWRNPDYQRQYGHKGKSRSVFKTGGSTDGKRPWHNPKDPVQAGRIEAAVARREAKAVRLERHALKADRNQVHLGQSSDSLLPFYVAK